MKKINSRGWTILEITIALTIFTLLGVAITTLYATGSTLMQISENKLLLQQQCRISLDRVLKELRLARASSVTINAEENSITFQIPESVDGNSGAITWSAPITYAVGGLNNTQLIRTQAGAADIVMANDINNVSTDVNRLRFTGNIPANPSLITVTMSMTRQTLGGHPSVATLSGQARVRNP